MATPQLGVFLKLPVPGQVKTRLGRTLGPEAAATAYRWMTTEVLDRTQSPKWNRVLFGEPRHSVSDYQSAFPEETIYLQEGPDLGARITRAFHQLLQVGPALIIGTDCVDLDEVLLQEAFDALSHHNIVLCPALDGGYTLVGLAKTQPALFENIAWSTKDVLAQTLEAAKKLGLTTHRLPPLTDIDTEEELKAIRPQWWEKLRR